MVSLHLQELVHKPSYQNTCKKGSHNQVKIEGIYLFCIVTSTTTTIRKTPPIQSVVPSVLATQLISWGCLTQKLRSNKVRARREQEEQEEQYKSDRESTKQDGSCLTLSSCMLFLMFPYFQKHLMKSYHFSQ